MSVTLHLGDCVEVMRGMDAQSVDLILTSPPYDNLRKYGSGSAFDFPGVAGECKRLLKPGGVLVWVVGDETKDGSESGTSFRQALHFQDIGLKRHDTMIWRKTNPMQCGSKKAYISAFEYMFVFCKGSIKTVNRLMEPCKDAGKPDRSGMARRNGVRHVKSGAGRPIKAFKPKCNVWDYGVGLNLYMTGHGHPAVFPLQLAIDHILSWTNPGDTVLDPFVGSGTTIEACVKTDRNGLGIDIDPGYLAIAERRANAARVAPYLFEEQSA